MCIMCEIRSGIKEAQKPDEKIGEVSLSERIKLLGANFETFEIVVKKNHNNLANTMKEFGELIGVKLNSICNRLEDLESKAILKPDYNPAEVGLNLVPSEGSFEWAIMHMKKGKKMYRDGEDHYYYFTQFGSLIEVDASFGSIDEDKLDEWEIDCADLTAMDWKIKE